MAWYRSEYQCYRCNYEWDDEWSSICDDECPACGARNASAVLSEDLTRVVEHQDNCFVVYFSPEDAEDRPKYVIVGRFLTLGLAAAFAEAYSSDQVRLSA